MDKNQKNDIITSDSKQGQLNFEENYLPHKINISYFVTLRCVSFWARLVCMLTPDSVSWRKRTVVVVVYDIDRDFVISRSGTIPARFPLAKEFFSDNFSKNEL